MTWNDLFLLILGIVSPISIIIFIFYCGVIFSQVMDSRKKIQTHSSAIDKAQGNFNKVSNSLAHILTRLESPHDISLDVLMSKSPYSLNEKALRIVALLKADAILEKYLIVLKQKVIEEEPETPYDVQQSCFRIVDITLPSIASHADMNALKNAAYNEAVDLRAIYNIFGVLLRDKILAERGMAGTDGDASEPR
jgi:hypothetical protein